jgi:hypothetical protein
MFSAISLSQHVLGQAWDKLGQSWTGAQASLPASGAPLSVTIGYDGMLDAASGVCKQGCLRSSRGV